MLHPVLAWMRDQRLHVRTECATPWGICDVIGASFRARNVKRRLTLRQRSTIGSQADVAVLATLPDAETGEGFTVAEIRSLLGAIESSAAIERSLDKLIQRRFVSSNGTRFSKINGWMPLHQRLVAVEMKLERVEEVFQQALNHTGFATESYVCLPIEAARRVTRSPKLNRLSAAGVGILGVVGSRVVTLRRSVINFDASIPWLQMHMVERFWRLAQRQLSMSASAIDSGLRVTPSAESSA